MEINIISKNLEDEMVRINVTSDSENSGNLKFRQYNSDEKLITGFDFPVKSLKNFIKELSGAHK